ncbi:TetR/AcrR family transcriptional regulator [Ascidiaceihabitans sp.]|uniref:TetR/AcrR family transcriptional regulator n=1 Tax=Ascidiaceihabitans sp. TaxID=1872644 RepID=UPI0032973EC5
MNELPAKLKTRADRKTAKRDVKKRQIADSAISALKELGYANTTLRDIAAKSALSLGMLHYYFADRAELIIYCVEIYKEDFVHKVAKALEAAQGRDQVIEAFTEALVASIFDDAITHRLWYDIRTQAMFDTSFRPVVATIEQALIGLLRTAFEKADHPAPLQIEIHYALLDGVFRHIMQGQFEEHPRTRAELSEIFRGLLNQFM